MFSLTQTFRSDSKVITPILFQGQPIFLTQEVGPMLGYSDLANSIRNSVSMREGREYIMLNNANLRQLKSLLNYQIPSQLLNSIKFSARLIILTKTGLQTLLLRSHKPASIKYKDWIIHDVLPSIEEKNEPPQPVVATMQQTAKNEPLACHELSQFVYFMENSGNIKIGVTASVSARLKNIQASCGSKIKLLGYMKGTQALEAKLHKRFRKHRIHGEWFRKNSDLLQFIETLDLIKK